MSARTPFIPSNTRPASRVSHKKDQNIDSSSNTSQFAPDPLHAGTDASMQKLAPGTDVQKNSAIKPLNLNGLVKKSAPSQATGLGISRPPTASISRRSSLENNSNDHTNAANNTLIRRDSAVHASVNLVTPIPRAAAQGNSPLYNSSSPVLQSTNKPFKTPAAPAHHSPVKLTHITASTSQDDLHREQFRLNPNLSNPIPPQRILLDDTHSLPGLIPKNRTKRARPDARPEDEQENDLVYPGENPGSGKRYKPNHHPQGDVDYLRQSFSPPRFSSPIDDASHSEYHRSPNMHHHQQQHGPSDSFINLSHHSNGTSQGQNSLDKLLGCQAHVFVEDHMEWYGQLTNKWRECTMEEWVKGADEIMAKYSKILDQVKKHMETKLKLFASFDAQVTNHKAVLEDRARLLDGVKQRLVSNSQTILGPGV
ncbi:hypothetical protein Moror_961 [Moniliophthora roreri MCA 2997]|uniref:Extracellular mutant protein 11 C-terminal domain-containing protein n=2 Tax=Moniliophthora roreri TaxID=221103 RepID=V2XQB5_MONRO|nr:hypothetical protein Moror_961 [Moniliophthora roreri MCA 2997]KAI3615773.1 hypothetical protein WG66_010316 [Moniliophthora roreri]